jgi:hypothetical protein
MDMRIVFTLAAMALALGLGGCDTLMFDPFGDDAPVVQPNGCTAAGCPQAATFCVNRGYSPGSDGYNRCVISVEENLRKGS